MSDTKEMGRSTMPDADAAMDRVLVALYAAFQADRQAIHATFANRVPCNQALADDPHIQVCESPAVPGTYTVGTMGLINGVLSAIGLPLVAGMWGEPDEGDGGRRPLVGFARYRPPGTEETSHS